MVNEFAHRTYSCGEGCHCMYQTDLASQCRIDGKGVLAQYGYKEGKTGEWVGILLAILQAIFSDGGSLINYTPLLIMYLSVSRSHEVSYHEQLYNMRQ
ncbi:MAG: hypothetical protein LQ346_003698 [Caloplaca aetnensis]|nr:MAG: hypothetical protein LQ346_003698 [Caloplaca aetnensis]